MSIDNPFGTPGAENVDNMFEIDLNAPEFDTTVPEGTYVGKCIDVIKGVSKAGNPQWIWTIVIIEGPYAGEEFKLYTAITPSAIWKLTETLDAFGLVQAGQPTKFTRDDVVNVMVDMEIVPDEYKGQKKASLNKILQYHGGVGKKHTGATIPF